MIQGGGFEPGMGQKANRDPIDNEADNGLSNLTGTWLWQEQQTPFSNIAIFYQC